MKLSNKERNHLNREKYLTISFALLSLGIAFGAVGAHALEKILEAKYLATFETGVRYMIYHTLGLMMLSSVSRFKELNKCRFLILIGIIFFSGNCLLYAFTKTKIFALLVPIGGFSFIIGWIVGLVELNKGTK